MNIVTGSGRHRKTFVFPHATIVHKSPPEQQLQARDMLCRMLNVSVESELEVVQ